MNSDPALYAVIEQMLDQLLSNCDDALRRGLYAAALPRWYDADLFQAIAGQQPELLARVNGFSFVLPLPGGGAFVLRPTERAIINRHWIQAETWRAGYRPAHERALAHLVAHPHPDPFVQARDRLYHTVFVDLPVATADLIQLYDRYAAQHRLGALEQLLAAVAEAADYLALLEEGSGPRRLRALHTYMQARLLQLQQEWEKSSAVLATIDLDASAGLRPYVTRAYGYAEVGLGRYDQAIDRFSAALAEFNSDAATAIDPENAQADKAQTLLDLGDAYIALARHAQAGEPQRAPLRHLLDGLRAFYCLFMALPLVLYLVPVLGRRVWRPRFWLSLEQMDWVVARYFSLGKRYYDEAEVLLGAAATVALRRADLWLKLGDAEKARQQYRLLLDLPLPTFEAAGLRVSLADAEIVLGQPAAALRHLAAARAQLSDFPDAALQVQIDQLLGDAARAQGDPARALEQYASAVQRLQASERPDNVWLTDLSTRLAGLAAAYPAIAPAAAQVDARITTRSYRMRFRHPATMYFQRLFLASFGFLFFLLPALTVRLDRTLIASPLIHFNVQPILTARGELPNLEPLLTELLTAPQLRSEIADYGSLAALGWAVLFFVVYAGASFGAGIWVISHATPARLQQAGEREAVTLDTGSIASGDTQLPLASVTRSERADVYVFSDIRSDDSQTVLRTANGRVPLQGNLNHYLTLRGRVESETPTATRRDLSYRLAYSGWMVLAILTFLAFATLIVLDLRNSPLLNRQLIGGYTAADLYVYLFAGYYVPAMMWYVLQPLWVAARLDLPERHSLPAFLTGVALTLGLIAIDIRSLGTALNIYLPLSAAIGTTAGGALLLSHLLRQRPLWTNTPALTGGRRWLLLLTLLVVIAATLVLHGRTIWRDVRVYHNTVLGTTAVRFRRFDLAQARYARATALAEQRVLGRPSSQLVPTLYVNQALASVRQIDDDSTPGAEVAENARLYREAVQSLRAASALDPANVQTRLWLAAAEMSAGSSDAAGEHFLAAQAGDDLAALSGDERVKALTGLGWSDYFASERTAGSSAVPVFAEAVAAAQSASASASAEAHVGLGYALYADGQFDAARTAWETALALDPQAATYLALAAVNWQLATNRESCLNYTQAINYFDAAVASGEYSPASTQIDRLRQQVVTLARQTGCAGVSNVAAGALAGR